MDIVFKKSTRKNKKYMVKYNNKIIHFGDKRYEHYEDKTPLKLYSNLDHKNDKRRLNYLRRAMGIRNKKGELTYKDPSTANYYAIRYLW
jgi:hypothetical protein